MHIKVRLAGFTDDEFQFNKYKLIAFLMAKQFNDNKEMSILVTIGLYALNIIDANVDAHLMQYNIDDNLSLSPVYNFNEVNSTSDLNFKFKIKIMKIGIIGYGKMGKAIEKIALKRGHSIVFKVIDYNTSVIKDVDIAIDFSTPESAVNNIYNCLESNSILLLVGTTGWLDRLDEVKKKCEAEKWKFFIRFKLKTLVQIFFSN